MDSLQQEQAALEQQGGGDANGGGDKGTALEGFVGKGKNAKYMTPLPEDFQPSEMDVICGRGKRIWEWKVRSAAEVQISMSAVGCTGNAEPNNCSCCYSTAGEWIAMLWCCV